MSRFDGAEKIGLRDNETNRLIAVYPHKIEGSDSELEEKVKFWYYQKSCSAEEQLRKSHVDVLSDEEIKSLKQ